MDGRLSADHLNSSFSELWSLDQRHHPSYDVVIIGSMGVNPGYKLINNPDVPQIADEYMRGFRVSRSLPCDVPLGSHPGMYRVAEKYARLGKGPNRSSIPRAIRTS